jgi:hypothetical protein
MFVGRNWVRFLLSCLRHERFPSNPIAVLLFSFLATLVLLSFSHVQVICRHRRSIWLTEMKICTLFLFGVEVCGFGCGCLCGVFAGVFFGGG